LKRRYAVVLGVESKQTMATYEQLTLPQRYTLQALYEQRFSQKHIAKHMAVSEATISRELTRNGNPATATLRRTYCAQQAQQRAADRCQRDPYKITGELEQQVLEGLRNFHSPDQISGQLARQHGRKRVSHETIYQYVYRRQDADGEPLTNYLRIRHRKRYKKRGTPAKRQLIPNRVGIEQRPAVVETNTQRGHWEADTVIGKDHDGVLLTLVERVTKYTLLVKLPTKEAVPLAKAAARVLWACPLPTLTITFDNGTEFVGHEYIGQQLGAQTFFADPHSPWQRGLNENTNGLIRQFIPKSCRISEVKASDVSWIQDQLNNRPRKSLGYLTPAQLTKNQ
jgi:transposase, IS30 family